MKFTETILCGVLALFSFTSISYAQDVAKMPFITHEQPNPGLDIHVPVNPNAPRPEPGVLFKLNTLPLHGVLYYEGQKITELDQSINDVGKVSIDPEDGNVTVIFSYTKVNAQGKVAMPRQVMLRFHDTEISGSVFHDFDGNDIVDGEKISNLNGEALFITLINKNNEILSSKAVSEQGTFHFNNSDGIQPNTNYALVISTQKDVYTSILPRRWSSSGENINSLAKGKDGHKDGIIVVKVRENNIRDIDFGLDIRPLAVDKTKPAQLNPGGSLQVPVPTLEGSDEENGMKVRFYLTSLPKNATLFENGKKISKAGKNIKDISKLTLDPNDGDQTVVFNYVTADHIGVVSHSATVTMPFTGLKISGNVFNDGNGNDKVDGKILSTLEGKGLYVALLNEKNTVLESLAVNPDGKYSFNGTHGVKPDSTYTLVLSTNSSDKTSHIPKNWRHSGEAVMQKKAGDASQNDGVIKVDVMKKDVSHVDFGLNKKPEAEIITAVAQLNPGSNSRVTVPMLKGIDNENSESLVYSISALPKNGQLYYEDKKIDKEGFVVNDPSKLMFDPVDGNMNVSFSYKVADGENVYSESVPVTMIFNELQLSGHLFDDGTDDDNVSGSLLNAVEGNPLYVLLLNTKKELLSTKMIQKDGSYLFSGKDGVKPESKFFLALATKPKVDAFGLPKGWNNTAEKINSGDSVKDNNNDGVITVTVNKMNVTDIDFGINQKPTADAKTVKAQLNPGSYGQVAVPVLSGKDRESGTNLIYKIESLPTTGVLYYDGVKVEHIGFTIEEKGKLTLDPRNSDVLVLFTYAVTDQAGIISDPARVEMPFTGLMISGRVVNDGKGDEKVKGKAIKIPKSMKPYATLLDENNMILASNPIHRDGSFSFNGEDGVYPNALFSIVLSLEANATSAVLPEGWYESGKAKHQDTNNTTELYNPNGKITIHVREKNVDTIEFGVNKEPSAENVTIKSQVNPGGETRVTVPVLSGNDREDGKHIGYMVTTLPENATLYDKDKIVFDNDFVDPSSLTLDPKDGMQVVTFSYVTVDSSKVLSAPATVSMSFSGLNISGSIFEDFIIDGVVDSVHTIGDDKIQVFMTMLNDKDEIIASVPVKKDGTYLFDPSSGVNANTKYRVVLSKDANSTASILPNGWHYADGENVNSLGHGTDGKADGMIDVSVKDEDLKQVDFGINYLLQ